MRKQTKLVAVLSAAALLAIGASMTSFAAGWQKSDDGTWQYYDKDDEMVTGAWEKFQGNYFYLDDDGNMMTNDWVDDSHYVDEKGIMLTNSWKKTVVDADDTNPDAEGESWYYFGSKGEKIGANGATSKKIGGKTYYFDDNGKMKSGWYSDSSDNCYYLGDDDEGARVSGWLWLEAPTKEDGIADHDDSSDTDPCDEEGWYYFGSDGKMYKNYDKKKINGKYYFFNEHGQMLYEWINDSRTGVSSNAELDGNHVNASPSDMKYMNTVEEGWRADGWYEISGSEDTTTENDTDWYFFDKGSAKKASLSDRVTKDGSGSICRTRAKANGKFFCFNQYGQMQTGLQYSAREGFYYFDEKGYMKTGKVASVDEQNETFAYSFNTKTGGNGLATNGVKDNYLYFHGKRLEANDDNRLYTVNGKVYLVNKNGKIQKSKSPKEYTIENSQIVLNDKKKILVTFSGDEVVKVGNDTNTQLLTNLRTDVDSICADKSKVTIPRIELYDDIFTYTNVNTGVANWLELN